MQNSASDEHTSRPELVRCSVANNLLMELSANGVTDAPRSLRTYSAESLSTQSFKKHINCTIARLCRPTGS